MFVRNFPLDGVAVFGFRFFGLVYNEVCAVVGSDGAEGGDPQVVFEGVLEEFLDVARIDGVIVAGVVGHAVIQHHQPGAAFHGNFPGICIAEIPDVCGGV